MRPTATGRRRDDGSVSGAVVATAVALTFIFLVVQVGLYYFAREVARGAAFNAVDAARVENGTAGQGEAFARQFLDRTRLLEDADVTVTRSSETVTATVTGSSWTLQPFHLPIHVTVAAPVERIVE